MHATLGRAALCACLLLLGAPAPAVSADQITDERYQLALQMINRLINRHHYRPRDLDDALAGQVFERYLELLDPDRRFFLAADIDQFERYRHMLDEHLREGSLNPAREIFNRYRMRVAERIAFALDRLEEPFDFSLPETLMLDGDARPWAKTEAELDDRWRRRLKHDILTQQALERDRAEIDATLRDRYRGIIQRTEQLRADDIFQLFVNAYIGSLEPHTSYLSPRATENFKIQLRLSLEGIGAVLQNDDTHTRVRRIIPGGPASRSGELQAGDIIIGVGHEDEAPADVVGWRLDDVVALIRGPKGTRVQLEILPDGHPPARKITIQRGRVKLQEQAAQRQLLQTETSLGQARIGVIRIPSFYIDFDAQLRGERDFRSTTRDVRALLDELLAESIDGLVIDLRDNSGGGLSEAVALSGLFIRQGPVVQVQNRGGFVQINRDPDAGIAYAGPLLVMVNRESASAAEIFAGAMQDYRRALVVGEPTFGKGTVQSLIDLGQHSNRYDNLGQLRLTIAQFFRINGDSTQFHGITPDLPMSTDSDPGSGERSHPNALPWQRIDATNYQPWPAIEATALTRTVQRHHARLAEDRAYQVERDLIELDRQRRAQEEVSLNAAAREAETREWREEQLRLLNARRALNDQLPLTRLADQPAETEDEQPDLLLEEAGRVLTDLLFLDPLLTRNN